MIESNGNIVYSKLRSKLKSLEDFGSPSDQSIRRILFSLLAVMKQRIFQNGLNANMKGMGVYSQQYLAKVRKANGWSDSKVTLELTGEMRREFTLGVEGGTWVIGFEGGDGTVDYKYKYNFSGKRKSKNNKSGTAGAKTISTKAPDTGKRASILEKKYGLIFQLSQPELETSSNLINSEIARRLNG